MSTEEVKNILSKNLEHYMTINDINNKDLSQVLGVSESTVGKWLLRKSVPRMGVIEAMAAYFNIQKSDLLEDKHRPVLIPVLGHVQAGVPIEAIENIIGYEEITDRMASTGDYFCLKVKGNSMLPKFSSGDIVVVRKQPDVENGQIAIVIVNGCEATMKIVHKFNNGITLVPTNPEFEPRSYTTSEIETLPVEILGRVVELRAKF